MNLVSVTSQPRPPANVRHRAATPALDTFRPGLTTDQQVPPKLAAVLQAAGKPYYDEAKDVAAVGSYYQAVDKNAAPETLYGQLSELVRRTHQEKLSFDPLETLHPWVDLRPNLRLQSIYSSEPRETGDKVNVTKPRDFQQKIRVKTTGRKRANGTVGPARWVNRKCDFREAAKQWVQVLAQGPTDALQIASQIARIEGYKFYNAEHVVPQFFFDRDKTPKGDLHHLMTCERNSNSYRGCRPFGETVEAPENRAPEGFAPKTINRFEPDAGKGAVARATLYFLLRYPGKIGDKEGEYNKSDVAALLQWHKDEPVSLYEKHRNQAIAEVQGNRNPFIDFPELAEKVDFTAAFGEYGRTH